MGTLTASTLATELLTVVRDAAGTASSTDNPPTGGSGQSFAFAVLNEAQAKINAWENQIITDTTLTLTADVPLYGIAANFANAIRMQRVLDPNGLDLDRVDYKSVVHPGSSWYDNTAATLNYWATIGRDILLVSPTPSGTPQITAYYTQDPTVNAGGTAQPLSGTATLILSDDSAQQVVDLSAAILLIKLRAIDALEAWVDRLKSRYMKHKQMTGRVSPFLVNARRNNPIIPPAEVAPYSDMLNGKSGRSDNGNQPE